MTWHEQEPLQPVGSEAPAGNLVLGQDVFALDGQRVGSVAKIEPDYLIITRGPLNPPERAVPRGLIRAIDQQGVHLAVPLAQIQSEAPEVPLQSVQTPTAGARPAAPPQPNAEQVIELKEERLVPHKELRQVGEIEVRTVVEEVPSRLDVETQREEVVVEHVPIGQTVDERRAPWEDDGTLVIPVYEEQIAVVKRLVLKEELRVRRVRATEHQTIEEPVRRERAVVHDPNQTGLVHERYAPQAEAEAAPRPRPAGRPRQPVTDDQNESLGDKLKKMLG
ncbi:MAG TPA: YsnF/AvaK domain-containing protein [Thermomicrobiaceae bacterium]|nr:YsnF/AvaK domain-containing protein [Thermomicrobiaceae bacterium]